MSKVFFITGCTSGFGNELVKKVLKSGDKAVACSRNSSKLSFSDASEKNYLGVDLDVTSQSSVDSAFKKAVSHFKNIDVVVNNAGYGLNGEFESLTEEQIRKQMEVNFFGLIKVTKRALEHMRESGKGGVIQQVTSVGGQVGVPYYTSYCASKWAVEGFTETLAKELKPEWNIKLTIIEPGGFRTDWAGSSMEFAADKCAAYDHMDGKKLAKERNGTQPGDPPKAARAMYDLAVMPDPPLRCALGSDAFKVIGAKLKTYQENHEKYAEITNSCDVD
ncbi:hypothetical protein CBS101457_002337 [Exobasidium rhododendri]|nr:hypothetical protein CBS101457_002337 [Exobasidium rhododendri]